MMFETLKIKIVMSVRSVLRKIDTFLDTIYSEPKVNEPLEILKSLAQELKEEQLIDQKLAGHELYRAYEEINRDYYGCSDGDALKQPPSKIIVDELWNKNMAERRLNKAAKNPSIKRAPVKGKIVLQKTKNSKKSKKTTKRG